MSPADPRLEMITGDILPRLARKYLELCEFCYRVSVASHDGRGRFSKGHRGDHPHPALLKKMDLDRALARLYRRFFDPSYEDSSTSTSNSRCQGSEARTSPKGSSSPQASNSE